LALSEPSPVVFGRAPASRPGLATWACLACVILSWGGNWPFIKVAVGELGPFSFTAIRIVGAAAVLALIVAASRAPFLPPRGERAPLALIGLCQVALMLALSAIGLQFVTSGRGIVLGYTFQLWTIPIGAALLGERIGRRQALGAAIGLAGLVFFFNPGVIDWSDARALFGNALIILGSIAWALGSCLYRRRRWRSGMWTQTFWQMAVSAPVLVAVAVAADGAIALRWSGEVTAILLFNWIVPTAIGYWWWAKILAAIPASLAGQVLMLTPVVGFLISAAAFGEPISTGVVASIVLIVAGLMVVTVTKPAGNAAAPVKS
jgi:drug/metabolite transporter (DMT)-like permease